MKIYEGSIADIVEINNQPTLISKNGNLCIQIPEEYLREFGLRDYEKVIDFICGVSPNIFSKLISNLKVPIVRNWATGEIAVMRD